MAAQTFLSLLFLGVASLVQGGFYPLTSPDNKIHSGSPAEIARFPWTVAILVNDYIRCGGGIISEYWVLTAAHCTTDEKITVDNLKVRAGSDRYDSGGQVYLVDKIKNHAKYDPQLLHYDIGLLKTKSPIRLGGPVSIAKLADSSPSPSTRLTVAGWGNTEARDVSLTLKAADVVICADQVTGINCPGDSGGPAVKDGVVFGLVSVGITLGNKTVTTDPCPGIAPTLYTKVAFFRDWIRDIANV